MGFKADIALMELTGNPFVDTGLAVIAAKAGCSSVGELTLKKMSEVHGNGEWLARTNKDLKSTSMIFTINSLSTHPGIKPPETRVKYYSAITSAILNSIGAEEKQERCECCGAEKSLDLDALVRRTLLPLGYPDDERHVGRDWFPLAGSISSDAQALPSASRTPNICSTCLFAVHYLPLGAILMNGRLAIFQSTSERFWFRYVTRIAYDVMNRITIGEKETLGAKRGSTAVVEEAFKAMDEIRDVGLEPGTTLFVWRFSNSGTGPDCEVEEIPSHALEFLYEAKNHGFEREILRLMSREGKNQFLQAIQGRKEYYPLYPRGKHPGADPKLFHLYHSMVRQTPSGVLETAHSIAEYAREEMEKQRFDKASKELHADRREQNTIRRLIAEMAAKGTLTPSDYIALFSSSGQGAEVRPEAWRIIEYYMKTDSYGESAVKVSSPEPLDTSQYYAATLFSDYLESHGKDRFQREVLNQMEIGKIGTPWLQRSFVRAAEKHPGFSYGDWKALTYTPSGWDASREVLFRMRLHWGEWIKSERLPEAGQPPEASVQPSDSDLTRTVESALYEFLNRYVEERGVKRFRRDIINALLGGDLDLYWFREKLSHALPDLSRDAGWECFTCDSEGTPIRYLRLFQLRLATMNFYREKII